MHVTIGLVLVVAIIILDTVTRYLGIDFVDHELGNKKIR